MKKHKSFVIFQILLYSCSGTEDTGFTFTAESFDETYHLSNGKTYRNDSLFLGKPKYISFHPDSFLLFSDVGKNLIKIIDLKSNKIQEIIPQGRGPGELITAWGIETKGKDVYILCPTGEGGYSDAWHR